MKNLRTYAQLIQDIHDYFLEDKLAALKDGNFLSQYDVTQEQVEDLYNSL